MKTRDIYNLQTSIVPFPDHKKFLKELDSGWTCFTNTNNKIPLKKENDNENAKMPHIKIMPNFMVCLKCVAKFKDT